MMVTKPPTYWQIMGWKKGYDHPNNLSGFGESTSTTTMVLTPKYSIFTEHCPFNPFCESGEAQNTRHSRHQLNKIY